MVHLKEMFDYLARPCPPERPGSFLVFALRHGESWGQRRNSLYKTMGDDKIRLTPKGHAQSAASGHILGCLAREWKLPPARVLASHGERATQTAQEIHRVLNSFKYNDASFSNDERLNKQRFGLFDGHFTDEERRSFCPEGFEDYRRQLTEKGLFHARPPEGESLADVRSRIKNLVDEMKETGGVYIGVTHGTNVLCLESLLLGHDEQWIIDNMDTLGNCQIRLMGSDGGKTGAAQNVCLDPSVWSADNPLNKGPAV